MPDSEEYDLTLAPADTFDHHTIMLHRADCPVVRQMAADGVPICTMFGVKGPLPDDLPHHDCLRLARSWPG